MYFSTYLMFDGTCRQAFEFYRSAIGGEIVSMSTFGQAPAAEHMPAECHDLIMHARLVVGGAVLMGSDCPPERYSKPAGFSVAIQADSADAAESIFARLSEGGTVEMPMGETFWSHRFGMCTDRFGVEWMLNYEKP